MNDDDDKPDKVSDMGERLSEREKSEILERLSEREKSLLKKHFGIDTKNHESLQEAARNFDVTRQRIREIEKRALNKLKRSDDDPDDAA